jgi:hypothetical protein
MRHATGSLHRAPLSPDAVLRILRGRTRHGALTRETTVWEAFGLGRWYIFCSGARRGCLDDAVDDWRRLFGIGKAKVDFEAVLWPPRDRAVGPVCDLIAAHAAAPCLDSPTEDHAFQAVAETLAADGADVAGLTPQTPLEPYLRRHRRAFTGPLFVLARGRIPPPDVAYTRPVRRTFAALLVAAFLAMGCALLGLPLLGPVVFLPATGASAACMAGTLLTAWLAQRTGRGRWHLGPLNTFGDLARLIAREHGAS